MLVAVCDQSAGTSTSRCSKITAPLSLPMEAVRKLPLHLVVRRLFRPKMGRKITLKIHADAVRNRNRPPRILRLHRNCQSHFYYPSAAT